MNRGALPLAILIIAALAAGIAVAVIKPGDLGEEQAGPGPIETNVVPQPTDTLTAEPTEEPTEEPSPEPTETGGYGDGNGNGSGDPTLAETGGPVLPALVGGALMFLGGLGLMRLRRDPA